MLVPHADSDYGEWGARATARLDHGARGRGLSFSLSPTLGAASSAAERLWGGQDACLGFGLDESFGRPGGDDHGLLALPLVSHVFSSFTSSFAEGLHPGGD